MAKKQLKLGAFFLLPGHHVASWRYPSADNAGQFDLKYLTELTKTAERGKFDMVFFADVLGQDFSINPSALMMDPTVVISTLAASTEKIGFTATASTTYDNPFHVARKFATADLLSNGRAAWNVVTSTSEYEAHLFGKDSHLQFDKRYDRAEEFVDVVKKLWFSIEKEALVFEKDTAQIIDIDNVHRVEHQGDWFNMKGTLGLPATPQGHPIIVQAGSSAAGIELAARTAEVVFTAWQTLEEAQAFYKKLKGRMADYGRHPDELKIMPGVFPIIGRTEQEAEEKRQQLWDLIPEAVGVARLSDQLGFDLSGYPIDGPLPELPDVEEINGLKSRSQLVRDLAKRENLTIRQLYQYISGGRGHRTIIGTPEQIADQLQEWLDNDAADGFNVLPPYFPDGLNEFVDLVIPELQKRGIYRTEYEGSTLREHLGLSVPVNPNRKQSQKV